MPWVSATPPKGGCDTPFLWGVKEKSHQCILNEGRLVQNIYVYTYVFIIDIYNIYIHLCNDIHLLKLFMVEMIFQTGGLKYGKKHIGKGKEWSQKKKKLCPPTSCFHPTSYSPSPHNPFPRNFSDIVDAQDPPLWNTTFATNTETSEQQKNMNLI